jgi:RimJ/RimL family protein N-acetyltransferase
MHHPFYHRIYALGATIMERLRDAVRGEGAGSRTEQVFFRGAAARQHGMPWHGSFEDADSASPELGLWLKESAHGQGFGREVVASLIEWGHASFGKESFSYPVAVENTASRRIAENLHGKVVGNRTNPKYNSVVYRIPFFESPDCP